MIKKVDVPIVRKKQQTTKLQVFLFLKHGGNHLQSQVTTYLRIKIECATFWSKIIILKQIPYWARGSLKKCFLKICPLSIELFQTSVLANIHSSTTILSMITQKEPFLLKSHSK